MMTTNIHNHNNHDHYHHHDYHNHDYHNHDMCHDYCPSHEDKCFIKYILEKTQEQINESQPDLSILNALVSGIDNYECSEGKVYDCKDIILFKGALYKSLKDNNDRHPHDIHAWQPLGKLTDLFIDNSNEKDYAYVKFPYHASCGGGGNCVASASEGQCVAVKVDTGEVDSCGKPIYQDEIYTALVDTCDPPSPTSEDWEGPNNMCDATRNICDRLHDIQQTTTTVGG